MKKGFIIAVFFLVLSNLSFGQFNIIDTGGKVVNNDTIVVEGNTVDEMHVDFDVVNTGIDSVSVYLKRDSISTPTYSNSGYAFRWDNTFCWVFCYSLGDAFNVSPSTESLNKFGTPGDTSYSSFVGYYMPYNNVGAALIRYTFFAARNHADSASVIVKFEALPLGVKNISGNSIRISSLYPNPANNSVIINYNLTGGVQSANLKVFNMLGECIRSLSLSTLQGTTNMNVQGMSSGIYVCELQAQGCSPVYQKLVVSH